MKKLNKNYFSTLLLSIFFLSAGMLNAQIDLELSLNQTNQNPDAWANYSITATITNAGPETAQGITVAITKPTGTVYQGGNEFTASAGTFSPYNTRGWKIPNLGPNGSATLTLNLFTLEDNVAPIYAQVKAASPEDVDSTPNNGVAPTVTEDDEAYSGGTPTVNRADLRLSDVQIDNSGQAGNNVYFTLDLVNGGNATAQGDYAINVYLSPSAGQVSGTLVGEINTGNTSVGTIDDVNGAINIPADFPAGNGFVVFYVDAEGDITESNENNNIVSVPFEVLGNAGPGDDFCGFEKTFFNMPDFLFNPRPILSQTSEKINDNYNFKVRSGNSQVGVNYVDLLIDAEGNQLSIEEEADPFPNTENLLESGRSYEADVSDNRNLNVLINNANGSVIFDRTYPNLVSSNRSAFNSPKIIEKPGGYYVYGSWVVGSSPFNALVFLVELDANGNLLGFVEDSHTANGSVQGEDLIVDAIEVPSAQDIILSVRSRTRQEMFLVRMNLQGVQWSESVVGDLVSNRVPSIQYHTGEKSVYVLLFFALEQYVRKINASNGSTLWTTKLSEEFNPNSNSIRRFNLSTRMVVTADGGVATGYVFRGPTDNEFQTEIGKLDRNGNAVWWRQFDWNEVKILEAMCETADGGIIYAGRTSDNYVVYKLNQNGQPTPACNTPPTGDNVDLELTYAVDDENPSIWSFFTTTLSVSNTGSLPSSNVVVSVSLPNGVVYRGGNEYTSTQGTLDLYGNGNWNVGTLAAGATAQIQINYFLKTSAQTDFYAQVIAANGDDQDSSPNNGTFGVVNEDDEATIAINEGSSAQDKIALNEQEQLQTYVLRKVYPNPAIYGNLNFILDCKEAGKTTVQIYNSQGQLSQQEQLETTAGTNQLNISIDQLSSGLYYLMIADTSGKVASANFFVERD